MRYNTYFVVMPRLSQLCRQQRERRESTRETRHKLAAVLHSIRQNSMRAITLLGQLQNQNETCLAQGNVICSKIQHAVIECDPNSVSVAACVNAIDVAVTKIATSSSDSVCFIQKLHAFSEVSAQLSQSQKTTSASLKAMSDAHQDAYDVHSFAVDALENGFGVRCTDQILCACCGGNTELMYAARTGMCETCAHKHSAQSQWRRSTEQL